MYISIRLRKHLLLRRNGSRSILGDCAEIRESCCASLRNELVRFILREEHDHRVGQGEGRLGIRVLPS